MRGGYSCWHVVALSEENRGVGRGTPRNTDPSTRLSCTEHRRRGANGKIIVDRKPSLPMSYIILCNTIPERILERFTHNVVSPLIA